MKEKTKSPWTWIPSLYLAEGLPYVAVMTISVIMYKRMGISNSDIALYTSWLYLPWVIKPFWSPFVDLIKTKRWWIVSMQLLIGAGLAGIAFTIPLPFFFQATLAFFWLLAFSSATHDIAADGFYMLALDTNQQALFVGIRSTFYRIATIVGQGLLIILAGFVETTTGLEPVRIDIEVSPRYTQSALLLPQLPPSVPQGGDIGFVVSHDKLTIGTHKTHKDSIQAFVDKAIALNRQNGFVADEAPKAAAAQDTSLWTTYVSAPLGNWIKKRFGEERSLAHSDHRGNIAAVAVALSGASAPDAPKVLNMSLNAGDKSIRLLHGERLSFDASNWNKPAYIIFEVDPKLATDGSAEYKGLSGNIPFAWSITFFVLAGLFVFFSLYHRLSLPKPVSDKAHSQLRAKNILSEFGATFESFFAKPQAAVAIFFMLTYRFSEAQLIKLINPFLLDTHDLGGLGLTTGQVGFVYGTVGIVGLMLGGIAGGILAAKGGLRKWLWPMALSMLLTSATFLYLSYSQTSNLFVINLCVFTEQFGYGFGFTAYMLYLMYFSDGEQKTAHYAICTGFMALGMMIPGMFAGWLQEQLGYNHFFVWIMLCSIIPIIAVSLLKIDPAYGKAVNKKDKK